MTYQHPKVTRELFNAVKQFLPLAFFDNALKDAYGWELSREDLLTLLVGTLIERKQRDDA